MDSIKDLSDALNDEVMTEVADNFFGTRKRLDDAFEFFDEKVERLRLKLEKVYVSASYLRCLCITDDNFIKFWKYINVEGDAFSEIREYPCSSLNPKHQFSFTAKGEYNKYFLESYEILYTAVNDYMVGSYVDSQKNDGRKILTVNRTDLLELSININNSVRKVNGDVSPSGVLQFTKSLKPDEVEKEKIGACVGGKCDSFDTAMKFKEIEFENLSLPSFPDLPEVKNISSAIKEFCKKVYYDNKDQIKMMIKDLS
ncbi:hypothetical protein [Maridesulfovibrio bastinii]|uniref:hypothetical protein n=1 Tax=Maridesulfovibrio bastinii TaxID=47157 RepID=UPI0003FF8E0B|nr:hypothetical protein [Maridesulfovibrio bastinii]